jgi:hypothetical protein
MFVGFPLDFLDFLSMFVGFILGVRLALDIRWIFDRFSFDVRGIHVGCSLDFRWTLAGSGKSERR